MRAEAIIELAGMLGWNKVRVGARAVSVICPISPWTHQKGADRHPSCSILIDESGKSGWRCHACGHHGTLNWLVTKWGLLSRGPVEAAFRLIEREEDGASAVLTRIDAKVERRWAEPVAKPPADDPEVVPETEAQAFSGEVPRYALERGLSLDTCRAWQLGYDRGFGDRPVARLVFPVRRADGKLVGLVGRAIYDGDQPKYLNYLGFPKSKFLYGLDKVQGRERLVVVEGMLDVIRLWEHGLPAAGIIGAMPSEAQAQLVCGFDRVYLALDRDAAGEAGERWLVRRLDGRVPVFRVEFPAGKTDPKEMTREEALAAVGKSVV